MQDKFNKDFLLSRKEFERNIHILREMLEDGKLKFGLQSRRNVHGLLKMRKLPNARIDLDTIDDSARLTANMAANLTDMKKINKDEK